MRAALLFLLCALIARTGSRPAMTFVRNRALMLADISVPISRGQHLNRYDGANSTMHELTSVLDSGVSTGEELVDWISTGREVISSVPRSVIHRFNLLHRGIGVLIVDSEKARVLVHKRAMNKKVFPGLWDMFVGGVSSAGEAPVATLLRELKEETNLDLTSQGIVRHVGVCTIETSYNHCDVDVYLAVCSKEQELEVRFVDGEIETGEWMSLQQLQRFVDLSEQEFVPDGMQVWRALPRLISINK